MEHNHVSCIVTTAGGIEEDFIKCLGNTYMGSFSSVGADLRKKGMNRIGNLVVPNANYCAFEDWVVPILDRMLEEQEASKGTDDEINWTPSKVIHRLGKEINDERSVYYWAYKNDIPVFCPALTDGSLGDMLYFHTFKSSPQQLKIDIVQDIRRINTISVRAKRAGMIILGGGLVKHHIANACLMRNGAESAVYINTAQEFDGSDAGARPDEAVSWGKIKIDADSVKVGQETFPDKQTKLTMIVNRCTWRLRRASLLLLRIHSPKIVIIRTPIKKQYKAMLTRVMYIVGFTCPAFKMVQAFSASRGSSLVMTSCPTPLVLLLTWRMKTTIFAVLFHSLINFETCPSSVIFQLPVSGPNSTIRTWTHVSHVP